MTVETDIICDANDLWFKSQIQITMLRFLVFTCLTDRYNSTHREFCQVLMTSLQGGSPQLLYPLLTWVKKKSFNDSYDHFGCIQVLIISLGDKLSRSLWNPYAGVLQRQYPFHSIFTCFSPATLTLMVKMNSDIAIIFIKVLSKTWMSKRTTSDPDGYAPMLLLLLLSFFFLFFFLFWSRYWCMLQPAGLSLEKKGQKIFR